MTKAHRTTEEEMEGPISFWGSRNKKHTWSFMRMIMMNYVILQRRIKYRWFLVPG